MLRRYLEGLRYPQRPEIEPADRQEALLQLADTIGDAALLLETTAERIGETLTRDGERTVANIQNGAGIIQDVVEQANADTGRVMTGPVTDTPAK